MRLAIITLMNGQPWGGSEALWSSLAAYALEQNDEVLVSVYDWGTEPLPLQALKSKGAKILYRKRFNSDAGLFEKIKRSVLKRVPSQDKNYQGIIDFKPDHIFISQGDSFDLVVHHAQFYELIKKNNIPYSIVCHGHAQYGIIPAASIWQTGPGIFGNAKNIFFVSGRQQQLAERRLLMRLTNAHFTWNPLNIKPPASALPLPEAPVISMAIVGGLVEGKGHDTALEILAGKQWTTRDWTLNIYGAGYGEAYLKKAVLFYGLTDKVFFHGFTDDIEGIWKNNHLLLVPSTGEGLPISLAEAMACGRTAVVTDVGGNAEVIEHNINGFIADSPTAESFSEAMEAAWRNKNRIQEFGKKAFDTIHEIIDLHPGQTIHKKISR